MIRHGISGGSHGCLGPRACVELGAGAATSAYRENPLRLNWVALSRKLTESRGAIKKGRRVLTPSGLEGFKTPVRGAIIRTE